MKNEKKHFNLQDAEGMTPEQLADKLFFDKYVVLGNLSHWKAHHKDAYDAAKRASNRVDPSMRERNVEEHKKFQPQPRRLTEDEQQSRDMVSEEEAERIFFEGQKPNHADNLKTMEPARAYWVKMALWSYGLLTHRPEKPVPKPESAEVTFPISPEIADKVNVPRDVHVTLAELVDLTLEHRKKEQEPVPVKIGD